MSKEINIIIRVMPNAEDVEISLPVEATPRDIIETLLDAGLGIPKVDGQSNPISYHLVPKGGNSKIGESDTLMNAQIQNGDVILMNPQVIAG